MSTFFNSFTGFAYNPAAPKEDEFNRLRDVQGWNPSSLDFRAQYKAFRTALVKETGAAVDLFFRNEYTSPHFTYRTNASPWSEFRRLMRCPGAVVGSSEWAARARFTVVFNEAFSRQIDIFFQQFSQFEYNPKEEPKAEFERLRKFKKWFFRLDDERPDELAQYEKARAEFFDAFIADFTYFFGVGEDIRDWEYLCDVLHISPMPKTPEACQVAIESYYVNIFNLYDHVQRGTLLVYHDSLEDLSDYSYYNRRVFPQGIAQTTCMKVLLRRLDEQEGMPPQRVWSGVITVDKRRRGRKERKE